MNGEVVAGILPAVSGGILPPGWKPDETAAKMAAVTGARRFLAPMRVSGNVEASQKRRAKPDPRTVPGIGDALGAPHPTPGGPGLFPTRG
jgi:hypothetical protein